MLSCFKTTLIVSVLFALVKMKVYSFAFQHRIFMQCFLALMICVFYIIHIFLTLWRPNQMLIRNHWIFYICQRASLLKRVNFQHYFSQRFLCRVCITLKFEVTYQIISCKCFKIQVIKYLRMLKSTNFDEYEI